MNNEKCVNCGISGVPLYLGLDGHLHCCDCIGMLIPDNPKLKEHEEKQKHEKN